MLIDTQTVNC